MWCPTSLLLLQRRRRASLSQEQQLKSQLWFSLIWLESLPENGANSMDHSYAETGLRWCSEENREEGSCCQKWGHECGANESKSHLPGSSQFCKQDVILSCENEGQDGYVIWLRSHAKRWQNQDSSPEFPIFVLHPLPCFFDLTDLPFPGWLGRWTNRFLHLHSESQICRQSCGCLWAPGLVHPILSVCENLDPGI